MGTRQINARVRDAQNGILYHASKCEAALRMAAFAESEPELPAGIPAGMQRLAAYHSEHAFRWAASLTHSTGGAA